MIRQQFHVRHYWEVLVFYNVSQGFFNMIAWELLAIGFPHKAIREIFHELRYNAKAVTCSNGLYHKSIILFNPHSSPQDYLDSIVHEAEHVKQAMLDTYQVEDRGEPPAYTIGYLISQMYPVFRNIICDRCYN